jgi:cytochrome c553
MKTIKTILFIFLALSLTTCYKYENPYDRNSKAYSKPKVDIPIIPISVINNATTQFGLSKHSRGTASYDNTGLASCAPCHESAGFKYVCANNTPVTFTLNSTTGKFANDFATIAEAAYGALDCNTCHLNLQMNFDKAYDSTDFYPLTTTAPVIMTMWAGAKTIDIAQNGGKSNLCIKCHQPRPLTTSSILSDGNVIDYPTLASNPSAIFYDSAVGYKSPNKLIPSYRTHVHYGGVGAIYAGKGGVEFPGSVAYINSKHTTVATCSDCHMAEVSGFNGGHTFIAKGNFNGCNVSGCHNNNPLDARSTKFMDTQKAIKTLLDLLGAKLRFLHTKSDATLNLWAGVTTKNYDGYLDIFDPTTNPSGAFQNPAPSSSWTATQKSDNLKLPKFPTLKNVQMGAIINFQLCLREYSLGIHNYDYSKALLQNSIDALTAAGY